MPRPPAAIVVPVLLLAACGGERSTAETAGVEDSTYVQVMARLVLLDSVMTSPSDHPSTGEPYDSMRARILRTWNVSGEDLLEFARRRGARPEEMRRLWLRVGEISDSLQSVDWFPPPDPGDRIRGRESPSGRDTAGAGAPPASGDTATPAGDERP